MCKKVNGDYKLLYRLAEPMRAQVLRAQVIYIYSIWDNWKLPWKPPKVQKCVMTLTFKGQSSTYSQKAFTCTMSVY